MRHDPAAVPLPKWSRPVVRGRYLLGAASGLAVLLAAAGCGGSASAGTTVSGTVTIAAVPGVDDAPIYLAQKDGDFAKAGLKNVVIKKYASEAAELSALQGAQADIAASDYGNIFYQQSQSADLRILADGYDATSGVLEVLTWPGSAIKSPLDLANTKVGLPATDVLSGLANSGDPVSLEAAAATQVLSNYLGNDASTVQWKSMSQAHEVSELEHHQLQAILVSEPYIYQAESKFGAVEVIDACSGSTANLPLSGYVAMNAWVKQNAAAAADFQLAIADAQSSASLTGQVQAILPGTTGMTKQDADLVTVGTYPSTTSPVGLERVVRLMSGYNMIKVGPGDTWSGAVPAMIVPGAS